MNCKQGDIAIVVDAEVKANMYRIVQVIERSHPQMLEGIAVHVVDDCVYPIRPDGGPVWVIESLGSPFHIVSAELGLEFLRIAPCLDRALRPLRDGDGLDEMLRIAALGVVS